jgi:mono/diheme cytochrome c family protein
MNRTVIISMALAALCLGPLGCKKKEKNEAPAPVAVTPPPKPVEPPKPDPKLVARGAYVANIAGCVLCHTGIGERGPDMDNAWAGGLEIAEKFGTWRSPNITQSKDNGIGGWTDEQILASIREGKRPGGEMLYPVMPYPFYNTMSDDDGKALVAFLRTLPANEKKVERTGELPLPKIPTPSSRSFRRSVPARSTRPTSRRIRKTASASGPRPTSSARSRA